MQQPRTLIATYGSPWRSANSPARGYFYGDPNDRLLSVISTFPHDGAVRDFGLHIPSSTFSSYIKSHPLTRTSTSIVVPWHAWGPAGSRVTPRSRTDAEVSIQRTRILRINLSDGVRSPTATLLDYHSLRVARALMFKRRGEDITILFDGTGVEHTGFETTLRCVATNLRLPNELLHPLAQFRAYLTENGVVLLQLNSGQSAITNTWVYTI
ncbi:hypothetical protein BV25DRAFT_1706630 [Artomyces pyxidatus]|uniref:Uncharacterized protein n=1 Tax=Artomyces pyxidatus TaxID=48021 RepID=A0ACB8TAP5_9AGAM|nr:hypothetical protein BV25DRAFT_1706630 [Artomyces pyxidatus]